MTPYLPRCASAGLLLLLAAACTKTEDATPTAPAGRDDNLALGNPSGAVTSTSSPTNYLLVKDQYTLSYNRDQGKPNWVSWHLSSAWEGSAPRQDDFRADPDLPGGWYQVKPSDYSGYGFDRGHHCPSADRTGSVTDNSATFLMSNMMPQAPNNNQQTWANLENYCRLLVDAGNELYIICGSYGRGGTGSNGPASTIAGGRVTVPSNCWKVVVVLPVGSNDVNRITSNTRVIAVNTPNSNSLSSSWGGYRTSVDALEAATGLDLLSALSTSLQAQLESKTDTGPTN
ncbi:DNA/RNA non-specific endonuclease [Hymenobacter sp. RP-2-7]|uniref:DNA/RNA non-specific endonuclease n=1 Tax=Hymenobacter polaris TaxID=2682546 RepID=A0A7Y0AIE2_9BACT|nr:DNA/RNA non-specific endonuclease [Hymenobacter polaris]NML67943.1 DNA/RNA non-specific endonuclease [Hymenobacter polaris]